MFSVCSCYASRMLLPYPVHIYNCCSMRNLCKDTALLFCPRVVDIACPGQRIYPRYSNSTQLFFYLVPPLSAVRVLQHSALPPFFRLFSFVRWTPDHLIKMSSWIFEYCPVLPYPNQDAEPSGTGTSISDLMTGYAEFRRYQCSNCLGVRLRSSK
jgi:hypothetical protein